MNLTETQKSIIRILFVKKESSRSLLANSLSLTNAALTLALKPLIANNLIKETPFSSSQRVGRKELKLELNQDYGVFFGLDIRKHHIYFDVMDFKGNLLASDNSENISFNDFFSPYKKKALAIGITVRGDSNIEMNKDKELISQLDSLSIPYCFSNNVNALAEIYALDHSEEENFLLIKYGPGVGSSIFVNGKPLGYSSELGHTFYNDKTIENSISYLSLLGEEKDEAEGTKLLLESKEKTDMILKMLSFALYNADCLLCLQKIILSGALLSQEDIKKKMIDEIRKLNPDFNVDKVVSYENYADRNLKKSCLCGFLKLFS